MNRTLEPINWAHLKSFADVCDHGSISAAARIAGVSQPTLSRHIMLLEQSIGAVLFERGPAGIELSPSGRQLKATVAGMRDLVSTLPNLETDTSLRGAVRLTASKLMSVYTLPPILAALQEEEPNLSIEVVPSDTTENLSRRDADIAIRMARPRDGALIGRKIGNLDIRMYGSKDYLDKRGRPYDAASLFDHSLIGYDRSVRLIEGFKKAGVDIDANAFNYRTDDQVLCWQLLCNGCGIGFAPTFLGDSNPQLERVNLPGAVGSDPIWLIAHRQLKTNRRIRRVFDFLAERLASIISFT